MSVGERQRLELLRALDAEPEVLLLDEPTAVLTDAEADRLLVITRRLADDGRAVVLITHRLREVVVAADRVAVLRNGVVVSPPAPVGDRTRGALAHEMVGEELPPVGRTSTATDRVVVDIEGLRVGRLAVDRLEVRAGEVLGVAGVDGNGQVELELALTGLATPEAGTITVDGVDVSGLHPRQRVATGIGYIPSDRLARALVGSMRCDENLVLGRTTWRVRRAPAGGGAHGRLGGEGHAATSRRCRCRAATRRSSSPPASCTARRSRSSPANRRADSIRRRPCSCVVPCSSSPIAVAPCCGSAPSSTSCWRWPTASSSPSTGGSPTPFVPPYDRRRVGLAMGGGE